jgi:hypothetical protein
LVAVTVAAQQGGGGGSSGLYDVLELILDRGLVIDACVRVSLIGIEILKSDVRIMVASVDTCLRFAEACNRLGLEAGKAAARSVSSSSLNSFSVPLQTLPHDRLGSWVGASGARRSTSGPGPASSGASTSSSRW